jgi:uncharacterized protein (TIRG00374 family)
MRRTATRFLSAAISAALLFALYRSIDMRLVGQALLRADPFWLVVSIGMIAPITLLRAVRFFTVAPPGALPGVTEALRLTLVASALNVVVPAKGGDLVKSYFIARRSETSTGVALAIVVFERLSDLAAMIAWCVLGFVIARPQVPGIPSQFWLALAAVGIVCGVLVSSKRAALVLPAVINRVRPRGRLQKLADLAAGWPDLLRLMKGRRRWIFPFSLLLWLTHLFQIWLFTVALAAPIPFTVCASLSALALMAGQLPLTVAGLGTRDVALVVLMGGYMAPESAAALGILMATRNLLPPLAGMPMMRPYLTSMVGEARRWRRKTETVD